MDDARARALLAERRARRERAERAQRAADMAATLRALFYDKQAAFFSSPAKRKSTTKTRRAGATTGGCSELLARAITLEGHRAEEGFRAAIIHSTRVDAKSRAWRNDTKSGIVDVLAKHGKRIPHRTSEMYELGGVTVTVSKSELALDFGNGSHIGLFGCDSEDDLGKLRGNAKHVFWIDEAQDPRFSTAIDGAGADGKAVDLLTSLYKGTIVPAAADFRAETWITGTPGKDLAGMFFDITRDDDLTKRLPGWEVHALSVVDNPRFGATPEERWQETAVRAMVENGWTEDDPDFQREWMGRWVKSDARFVYAVHQVPPHELTYAPNRLDADGFPDVRAALLDLPGAPERDYFLALGADLGTRDDFAFALWAWSLRDPVLYEVCSWKKPGLDYDEMADYLRAVREQAVIGIVVADAGGGGKPAVMGWSKKWTERYQLPIIEATKDNKPIAIKQYNNDIRKRLLKFRDGSPLLAELNVHRWSPKRSATGKMVEDPSTPNHCCDASLYAHRESYHHRFREEPLQPEPGSAQWLQREEEALADAAINPDEDFVFGW